MRSASVPSGRLAAGGAAPPGADLLEVDTTTTPLTYVTDDAGNVRGGVRTPVVDVPLDVLSGMPGAEASLIGILMGTTRPIPGEELRERYGSPDAYLAAYTAAADAAIAAGFVVAEDRDALLAGADASRVPT